jgi:hypothetical protein
LGGQFAAPKYFSFGKSENVYSPAVPPPQEGRIAIVTDVGSGMRWTLMARETNALDADGEGVWS